MKPSVQVTHQDTSTTQQVEVYFPSILATLVRILWLSFGQESAECTLSDICKGHLYQPTLVRLDCQFVQTHLQDTANWLWTTGRYSQPYTTKATTKSLLTQLKHKSFSIICCSFFCINCSHCPRGMGSFDKMHHKHKWDLNSQNLTFLLQPMAK